MPNNNSNNNDTDEWRNDKFIRISLVFKTVFKVWLLSVLHNDSGDKSYVGMTKDRKKLYIDIEALKNANIRIFEKDLSKVQMEKVLPSDGSKETDTSKWDICILFFFIKHGLKLPTCGNWKKPNKCNHDEHRLYYTCFIIKDLRNKHCHGDLIYDNETRFNDLWTKMSRLAKNLPKNDELIKTLDALRVGPLDSYQAEISLLKGEVTQHGQLLEWIKNRLTRLERNKRTEWIFAFLVLAVLFGVGSHVISVYRRDNVADVDRRVASAIENLKQIHIQQIGSQNFISITNSYPPIKRFAVNLEIDDTHEYRTFSNTERLYHISKKLNQHGTTNIESLIHKNSNLILLRGTGGIGKTFMQHTAALNWAKNMIWKDISFVFLFTFRELNLLPVTSFEELLRMKYNFLSQNATFEEIFSIRHKVVVILDGLDEFAFLEELESMSNGEPQGTRNVATAVYEILNPNNRFLPQRKVIITSRPAAADKLIRVSKQYLEWSQLQVFDILGFGSQEVDEFINNFIKDDKNKAKKIKAILRKSNNLMLMSRIPAYLRGLCEIYQGDQYTDDFSAAKTTTEIFIGQLAMYFTKHYRVKPKQKVDALLDIFKIDKVRSTVSFIAKLAKEMLLHETILIDLLKVNGSRRDEVDISGLLSIIHTPVGEKLEFSHLLLQEFLTALHYITQPEKVINIELYKLPQLEGCLHLYAGLQGALLPNTNSPKIIVTFLQNLQITTLVPERLAINYLTDTGKGKMIPEALYEYQNDISVNQSQTPISLTGRTFFSNNFHLLLYFLQHHSHQYPNFTLSLWFDEINDEKFNSKYHVIITHVCKAKELFIPRTRINSEKWNQFLNTIYSCRLNKVGENKLLSRIIIHDIFVDDNITHTMVSLISTYNKVQIINCLNENMLETLHQTLAKDESNVTNLDLYVGAYVNLKFCEILAKLVIYAETISIDSITDYVFSSDEINCLKDQINKTVWNTNVHEIKLRKLKIQKKWTLNLKIHNNNNHHVTKTWKESPDQEISEKKSSVYYRIFIYCLRFPGILFPFGTFCAWTVRSRHKTKWTIGIGFSFVSIIILFGKYFEYRQFEHKIVDSKMKLFLSDL